MGPLERRCRGDQVRACYPYSWVLLGKKAGVSSLMLGHPNSDLWTVCTCVQMWNMDKYTCLQF